ncbi:alpha-glucosidase [Sulfolobales archaeon HS-7]|nr:alpha-glucosidase [Sulfolobales archaeon HS-7]
MKIKSYKSEGITKFEINEPIPALDIKSEFAKVDVTPEDFGLTMRNETTVVKKLGLKERIFGLGEKTFELDRNHKKYVMWNVDPGVYVKYQDPMYLNVPFVISVNGDKATGFFFNSASKIEFDIGFSDYSKLIVNVPSSGIEFYVIEGPRIKDVIKRYFQLTGMPTELPEWSLGYMMSRYTYFPQDRVIELLDEMKKEGVEVSAVFLDIDFMENFKLFTWNKERFPNPQDFIRQLSERGIKLITIVDHSVRVEQEYDVFLRGMGKYCKRRSGELYVGWMWPGSSAYPDFFKEETRDWWSEEIRRWVSQGIDGIWLDMNEPTDFSRLTHPEGELGRIALRDDRFLTAFDDDVVHVFRGKEILHNEVRNAYPLYQAMATHEGLLKAGKKPFILSRSGFAGIQRYAASWTGDSTSSWDQLRLQLQMVLGMSISGIPYVGIDIGGFQGRGPSTSDSSYELLLRQYQMALFFPIYRTHKATDGTNVEAIYLPSYYKRRVIETISLRYRFLPYLTEVMKEVSREGTLFVRPLFYEFQEDEDSCYVDDEYMAGSSILFAPVIEKGKENRSVYLPGKWISFWTMREYSGYVNSENDLPIYVRDNSLVQLRDGFFIAGKGEIRVNNVIVRFNENEIETSEPLYVSKVHWNVVPREVKVDGVEVPFDYNEKGVSINVTKPFRRITAK